MGGKMMLRSICMAGAMTAFGFAAQAAQVTYNFATEITSVTKIFGLTTVVQDPSSPLLGNTGTGSLVIDPNNIAGGFYDATSEFVMTIDLGAGPETFTGADDFLGSAIFFFDASNDIIDVVFGVVDDDILAFPPDFDQIAGPRVVDFSATGFTSNTLTLEVQTTPIPLPASALLLIGGVAGLAALRRRRTAQV